MRNLNKAIKETRKIIELTEKTLQQHKEALGHLQNAAGKLGQKAVVPPTSKKKTARSLKVRQSSVEQPVAEIPVKNRPRPPWTAARRAKTLAALKKSRQAKKKAAS
jgi:hypothetical protein